MNVHYVFIRRRSTGRSAGAKYAHLIVDVSPAPGYRSHYDANCVTGLCVWFCYEDGTADNMRWVGRLGSATAELCDLLPLVEI